MNIGQLINFRLIKSKQIIKYLSTNATTWEQPIGYDTGIKIYNCVARKKVPLIVRNKNLATWYTCGPTVYSSCHIGHASCFVKKDILQRILRKYFHINLVTAMNITDIDDKIIRQSMETNENWKDLAKRYELEFWNDMKKLGVIEPDIKVRVSNYIPEIISFIQRLIDKQYAYVTNDGSVYMEISKYSGYGKLQNINIIEEKHDIKKDAQDFALWKSTKTENEPKWKAPWGNSGRPGWHIECSTMASSIFGTAIDFHCGGLDLRFPHHENEETQSCAHHNVSQWINYWIHIGKLHMPGDNEKMSKSLKNTIGIAEFLNNYTHDQFRMACVLTNYQNQMDFSTESMNMAGIILKKLYDFDNDINEYIAGIRPYNSFNVVKLYDKISEIEIQIDKVLKDNFNTSQTIHYILDLISFTNKLISHSDNNINDSFVDYRFAEIGALKGTGKFVQKFMDLFGFDRFKGDLNVNQSEENFNYNTLLKDIVEMRNSIRNNAITTKNKDLFQICDNIRDILKINGIAVKDHGNVSSWTLLNIKK